MGKLYIFLSLVCLCAQIGEVHAITLSDTTISNYTVWKDQNISIDGNLSIVNGGTLILDNSTVKFYNDYILEHGTTIKGNGNLTLLNNSIFGTDDYLKGSNILVYNTGVVYARDSTFQGLNGRSGESAIELYISSSNSKFYNVTFKDSYNSVGAYATDLEVQNCSFYNVAYAALSPAKKNFILKNSTFKNFPPYTNAVITNGILSGLIENNYFENMSAAGNYGLDIIYYNKNVILRNNELNNTTRAIVMICEMDNITVENNYVHDEPNTGLFIGATYNLTNITIRNNVGDNLGEGIVSTGHGVTGYNNNNFLIHGNMLTNQRSFGPAFSVQIQNSSVYNNVFQAIPSSTASGLKTLNYTSKQKGKIENVLFKNNTFDGYKYGMELHSGNNLRFVDTILKNSSLYDIAFFDGDSTNHTFINTYFNESKIYFDNDVDIFEPYWYANILVVDENGCPVSNAKVNITNIIDPNCTPLCINGESESSFVTNNEGIVKSEKNRDDTVIIQDYFQNKTTKIEYKYKITAEKDGICGSIVINPNITFYCQDAHNPNNIITVIIPKQSENNALIYLSPSNNTIIPNEKFKLSAYIVPVGGITGAQLDFVFDGSMASVNSVTEGDLLKQSGAYTIFSGGTINNSAGTVKHVYGFILGTANVSTPGNFATVNLTAGNKTGIAEFSLSNVLISDSNSKSVPYTVTNATVLIDTAPVMNPICCPKSVDEKSTLAFKVSAKDADGDRLVLSASGLPQGSVFNTTSGNFTWTPSTGQAGVYTITFKVSDGYLTDSQSVTITVKKPNNPPVINSFEPLNGSSFSEGERIRILVNASDANGQALDYSIRIDGVVYATEKEYVWETDYSSSGNHTIEVVVSDGIDEVKKQHIISITNCRPRWDVNEDGMVNILDITIVSKNYGAILSKPYPRYDVNQDGEVNIQDLTLVGYHFGETVN